MEPNEVSELKEQAEQGSESAMRPVAFSMSLIAVLVAITTVLGHRTHTEAVLKRAEASDVWNEYQAKHIRDYETGLAIKMLHDLPLADKDAAAKDTKEFADHRAKWAEDFKEEQKEAQGLEDLVKLAERKAKCFDLAEALLEIGLVISSVTLLTRTKAYWYLGIVFSVGGVISALAVFFLK